MGDPGVVHEHVDAAERGDQLVDLGGRLGQERQIELAQLSVPAERSNLALGRVRACLVGEPGDPDVEAVARERERNRLADPLVGAGDDRARQLRPSASRAARAPRTRA